MREYNGQHVTLDGLRVHENQVERVTETLESINVMLSDVFEKDKRLYCKLMETWFRSYDALVRFKATIYSDFAPYSFGFGECGFAGGFIFHGAGENFSVHLDDKFVGWSLHT